MDNIYQNILDDKYINKLPYPKQHEEGYKEKRSEYRHETARLKHLFYEDLCEEFGLPAASKRSTKIFEKAWEDGHAYGFSEVYGKFSNLVEFLDSLEEK